jgi:hypothetical protein
MEDYTMAICTDVGKKKGVVPGAKSARCVLAWLSPLHLYGLAAMQLYCLLQSCGLCDISHILQLYHYSKLRYIELELFGDFNYYLWGTFEFYMAIGIWLFALWIRIYVHYLAQYLYLVVSTVITFVQLSPGLGTGSYVTESCASVSAWLQPQDALP